jgi:hypothetical protein
LEFSFLKTIRKQQQSLLCLIFGRLPNPGHLWVLLKCILKELKSNFALFKKKVLENQSTKTISYRNEHDVVNILFNFF